MPDRSVETVSAWLEKHPSLDVVSRDGSSEYASVRIVDEIRRFGRYVSPDLVLRREPVLFQFGRYASPQC